MIIACVLRYLKVFQMLVIVKIKVTFLFFLKRKRYVLKLSLYYLENCLLLSCWLYWYV